MCTTANFEVINMEPDHKKARLSPSSEADTPNGVPAESNGAYPENGVSNGEFLIESSWKDLYIPKYSVSTGELVNSVQISPDQKTFATCSSKGALRIYDLKSGALTATLRGHTKGISALAFSPINSDVVATGSDDLTIRLWSIKKEKCIRIMKKHTYHITTVCFNSKGNLLISGGADETIVVWDLTTGRSLKTLAAHSDPVSSVCLSPDDTIIVSASYDGLMRLFDLESGQCLKTLVYNSSTHGTATASTSDVVNFPISHVEVTPNGKYILSSSLDGKIRLWDYMNNKVVKTYVGVGGGNVNKKYNSGARFITKTQAPIVVLGSDASGALFWDVQSKDIVFQLQPTATVLDLDICNEGETLVTCGLDGQVEVYELGRDYVKSELSRDASATPDEPNN